MSGAVLNPLPAKDMQALKTDLLNSFDCVPRLSERELDTLFDVLPTLVNPPSTVKLEDAPAAKPHTTPVHDEDESKEKPPRAYIPPMSNSLSPFVECGDWSSIATQLEDLHIDAPLDGIRDDEAYIPPMLNAQDMDIYGVEPTFDPLMLVLCKSCGKSIIRQRFSKHMLHCPRRPDIEILPPSDGPPPTLIPTPPQKRKASRSNDHSRADKVARSVAKRGRPKKKAPPHPTPSAPAPLSKRSRPSRPSSGEEPVASMIRALVGPASKATTSNRSSHHKVSAAAATTPGKENDKSKSHVANQDVGVLDLAVLRRLMDAARASNAEPLATRCYQRRNVLKGDMMARVAHSASMGGGDMASSITAAPSSMPPTRARSMAESKRGVSRKKRGTRGTQAARVISTTSVLGRGRGRGRGGSGSGSMRMIGAPDGSAPIAPSAAVVKRESPMHQSQEALRPPGGAGRVHGTIQINSSRGGAQQRRGVPRQARVLRGGVLGLSRGVLSRGRGAYMSGILPVQGGSTRYTYHAGRGVSPSWRGRATTRTISVGGRGAARPNPTPTTPTATTTPTSATLGGGAPSGMSAATPSGAPRASAPPRTPSGAQHATPEMGDMRGTSQPAGSMSASKGVGTAAAATTTRLLSAPSVVNPSPRPNASATGSPSTTTRRGANVVVSTNMVPRRGTHFINGRGMMVAKRGTYQRGGTIQYVMQAHPALRSTVPMHPTATAATPFVHTTAAATSSVGNGVSSPTPPRRGVAHPTHHGAAVSTRAPRQPIVPTTTTTTTPLVHGGAVASSVGPTSGAASPVPPQNPASVAPNGGAT